MKNKICPYCKNENTERILVEQEYGSSPKDMEYAKSNNIRFLRKCYACTASWHYDGMTE